MTLPERLNKKERNVWNAENFSIKTRRKFAEAVDCGDWNEAFRIWFRSAVDESIDEHLPPYRDVEGTITNEANLEEGQRVVVKVNLDSIMATGYVDKESTYRHMEVDDGEYTISAEVTEVIETDADTLETITYTVTDYTLSIENETIEVDTTNVPIGTAVKAPKITINSIVLEE
jgi:hypothetical protein